MLILLELSPVKDPDIAGVIQAGDSLRASGPKSGSCCSAGSEVFDAGQEMMLE